MQTVRSINPPVPVKDRLPLRLALLFVGTFLGVLVLLMAWTMFTTIADRRRANDDSNVAAPVIVIDPKIQSDLAKAMAFDAIPAETEVQNPFIDRAGIGTNAPASTASTATTAQQTGQSSGASGSNTTTANIGAATQFSSSQGPAPVSYTDAQSIQARYAEWLDRQKRGEFVGPESEVLVVEDLVPVGFASGGDRGAEVMLFSVALCRTFTFPAGTRFLNGFLNGFDQQEVVFTYQNGIRRKSYSSTEPCKAAGSGMAAIAGGQ